MKFLIVGLGSMGKRRIRNLQKLGIKTILGFDIRKDRLDECSKKDGIPTFSDISEAIKEKPDAMVISTPPDLHLNFVKIAIKNDISFFTELNLILSDVQKIQRLVKKVKSPKGFPSCTMLFHPMVIEIEKLVKNKAIGKIYLLRHRVGHHLASWHPWEDYREFFVSKKNTGGARELMQVELLWLTRLFSDLKEVSSKIGKISNLGIDIDDYYMVNLVFKKNILGQLLIDVFSKPSKKEIEIIGEKGTLKCDFNSGEILILKNKSTIKKKIHLGTVAKGYKGTTPPENLYENEMKQFINAINHKRKYPFSFNDEIKLLQSLNNIEKSSKKNRHLII